MIVLVLISYIIAVYLAIFKPSYFVVLFGVIGSVYDGYGIGAYMNNIVPIHYRFLYLLLYLALASSLFYAYKKERNRFRNEITIYLTFSIVFSLSIYLYTLNQSSIFDSIFSVVMDSLYKTADFTFVVAVILLLNNSRFNIIKMLYIYVIVQISIAALVIYLPNFGINVLDKIDGYIHNANPNVYTNPYGATLNNFYYVFENKYFFNKFAHFHNSNDTGFFFGTAILLLLNNIIAGKKTILKFVALILLIIMWANSGMRGPVVAIVVSLITYNLISRLTLKKVFIINIIMLLVILPFLFSESFTVFSAYLTDSASIIGRNELYNSSLDFLRENFFVGGGADLLALSAKGIEPHFLPLKIAVMSGFLSGLMVTYIVYIQPAYQIFKFKKYDFFSLGILFMLFFVSVTNNYTNIVLFNFLLASLIANIKRKKEESFNSKLVYIK